MGKWITNSDSYASRVSHSIVTVSMTPHQEANLLDEEALHCMNPEDYWLWAEMMQEQNPIDMETIWDE
jgi:hypothetical protein